MVSIALLFKIFIINEKSNFIFISSSVNVLINIIANYLLINNYELLGIASSTLIANFIFYIILFSGIYKFEQKLILNITNYDYSSGDYLTICVA